MFVHIRGRGTYSMLEGIGSNASILQRAKELGQKAIALTDLHGVYGVVDFYSKSKGFDIQPLIGVELPYIPQRSLLGNNKSIISTTGSLTLMALSEIGYHNLLSLVSASYEKAHFDIPCLDNEILSQFKEDIVVIIGGIGSYAYQSLVMNDAQRVVRHIEDIQTIMGNKNTIIDITAQSYKHYPLLKTLDPILIDGANQFELLIVTSSGFLYQYKDQKNAYETALAIKDNTRTYDPDTRKVSGDHHILAEDDVKDILIKNGHDPDAISEWLGNTGKLAELSTVKITLGQALFPNYQVSDQITDLYEKYRDHLLQG